MPTAELTTTIDLSTEQEARASELHRQALVIDCGSVVKQEPAHIDRARAGGVTATNHTVTHPESDVLQALTEMTLCRRWIDANTDDVLLATSVDDLAEAKKTNRQAIIFGPQNTEFLGNDLIRLEAFYTLGVRILHLTYQRQNYAGSGCGEKRDGGLSTFGRDLVHAMDELGIVVDLSHCGPKTSLDAINTSRRPVIFSHAHPYEMSPHIRAKKNDLLTALADKGGVIGITALSAFLYDPAQPHVRPGLRQFASHIRYLTELIGIDHVGIGLDFDETITPEKLAAEHAQWPELEADWSFETDVCDGLETAADERNVTRALVWAGYTDAEIAAMLGGNFLRVFESVWR